MSRTAERNEAGVIVDGRIDFGKIRVGDCVDTPGAGEEGDIDPFNVRGTPCDETHNAEAVALIAVEQDDYPDRTR